MPDSGTYDQATILRRQKIAEQMLAESSKAPNIRHWAQGLSHLAGVGADAFALNRLDKQAEKSREADRAAIMGLLGGGSATPAPAPAASPAPMASAAPDTTDRIVSAESGGDPAAKNPNSTASGPGQFIDSTWLETLKRNRPDLAAGKDDASLLALRTDPAQAGLSREMTDAYATQNRQTLSDRGLPVTPGSTYLAHFAGPGGASKVLSADPTMRVAELLSPAAIKANPFLQNMTAAELRGWADKKMGGGAAPPPVMTAGGTAKPDAEGAFPSDATMMPMSFTGTPQPATAPPTGSAAVAQAMTPQAPKTAPLAAQNTPQGVPDQQRNAIARIVATATPGSPAHQIALQMLGQVMKPKDYGFQTLPDGTILRTDAHQGTVTPIYNAPKPPAFVPNVSPNAYGVAQPGFVDPAKMQAFDISGKPLQGAPAGAQAGSADPNITGDAFLATMPKPQADQIKGIVEGRISPPGAFALKTPYWQKMLTDVAQYEPGFDLTKWGARAATAKDFASGKSAQNLTSFNTAIGHLDTLDKAAANLSNTSFPMFNTVKNMVNNATGDPKVKEFDIAKTAVADELTRAFRGTGGNVHDLVQWENAINNAGSPQQLRAAIRQATELLRSRIESMGETYNRGMNTKTEAVKLLSPKAQEAIDRLSIGERQKDAPKTEEKATGAPSRADIEAEMKRRGLQP